MSFSCTLTRNINYLCEKLFTSLIISIVNLVYTDAKFRTVRDCNVQSVTLRKNSAMKPFLGFFCIVNVLPMFVLKNQPSEHAQKNLALF